MILHKVCSVLHPDIVDFWMGTSLAFANILASALQQRQIPSAPCQDRQLMTCRGIVAIAIAEIPVILLADFSPPPHKIGALVVFADHQVMAPSGFVRRFPCDQIFMAIRTRMFTDHVSIPPN
jgi:hypothetical protein